MPPVYTLSCKAPILGVRIKIEIDLHALPFLRVIPSIEPSPFSSDYCRYDSRIQTEPCTRNTSIESLEPDLPPKYVCLHVLLKQLL